MFFFLNVKLISLLCFSEMKPNDRPMFFVFVVCLFFLRKKFDN